MIDSYTSLVEGCDSDSPELDLVEFCNSLPRNHAISVNRDLLDETTVLFLNDLKSGFTLTFDVQRNQAGYSRDVHGQLVINGKHRVKY